MIKDRRYGIARQKQANEKGRRLESRLASFVKDKGFRAVDSLLGGERLQGIAGGNMRAGKIGMQLWTQRYLLPKKATWKLGMHELQKASTLLTHNLLFWSLDGSIGIPADQTQSFQTQEYLRVDGVSSKSSRGFVCNLHSPP